MRELRKKATDELGEGLGRHGGDRRSPEARFQVDNINLKEGGTSESYAIRRLKRDHSELAEKVVSGEMSANAAAIQAGFRKKTLSIPLEPRGMARTLRRHLTEDQIEDLIAELARSGLVG